jgi:flagellar protein FliS
LAWKSAYLENRILSAEPLELVNLLYEHAIANIENAIEALRSGDIAARSKAITKTVAIIGELDSSLNHEVGGEFSRNLARLYQYIRERLTAANLRQEEAPLNECRSLLATVGEAWATIARSAAPPATAHAEPQQAFEPAHGYAPVTAGAAAFFG